MAEWREDTGCVLFETSIIAGMKRTLPSLVVDIWEESMRDGERSCEAERERPRKGILDFVVGRVLVDSKCRCSYCCSSDSNIWRFMNQIKKQRL